VRVILSSSTPTWASGVFFITRDLVDSLHAFLRFFGIILVRFFLGRGDSIHDPNARPQDEKNDSRERERHNGEEIELVVKPSLSLRLVGVPVNQRHCEC
jgi:hypothetical protein